MRDPDRPTLPRGYFGIGAERISKALNLGNLMRSAHGFGASFTFTIGATYQALEARADTSKGAQHLPHYDWTNGGGAGAAGRLPSGRRGAAGRGHRPAELSSPAPRAPTCWGRNAVRLSPDLVARCDYVVRIPTSFCVNLAMAGAIVMYDRVRSLGRFPPRPIGEGGPPAAVARPPTQDWPARRLNLRHAHQRPRLVATHCRGTRIAAETALVAKRRSA